MISSADALRFSHDPVWKAAVETLRADLLELLLTCPADNVSRLVTLKRRVEALDSLVARIEEFCNGYIDQSAR